MSVAVRHLPAEDGGRSSGELKPEEIRAAATGDSAATRALVLHTQHVVYRFVMRMLAARATPSRVEELTQEVYTRVFRALPRFDVEGPARFSTWLLTIAHHTVVDELRRPLPPETPLDDTAPGYASHRPDHLHDRALLGQAIADAVELLSPTLRSAFILRAYHERTHLEIANALDLDEGTIKSRLHRARKFLMTALAEVYGERHDG